MDFLELVRKAGIVPAATLEGLSDLPSEPTACAASLISKGLITKFQAKLLLSGKYKGFKLGQYIVKEQIGQGGMGAVYLAEHETLHRKVALKVLTPPKDSKDGKLALERFLREARAAAALDHPNIVRLHDIGTQGETQYLVMEYVDGQTLEQLLQKAGPISPSRAVGYIAQAAAGLQQAYEKGFVHRDIKPGNLMLAKDGTVKLLDMGLARTTEATTDNLTEILDKGAIVGTADYISPEQAMNAPVDIRGDIYALGASFFALVTGAPPFNGSTTQKLVQHQMKEAPSLASLDKTFPNGLSNVVAKMLAKKPKDRYQTPAELITALAEWLPKDGGRKVVAGLTGAASKELENTLSEIESATQRFDSKTRLAVLRAKQRKYAMWGGGAVAIIALGGLIGYIATEVFGKKKETTPVVRTDPEPPKPRAIEPRPVTKPEPKPESRKEPKKDTPVAVPKPSGNVLISLPLATMKPFNQTLGTFMDGTVRRLRVIDESGPGLPKPWYRWLENLGLEADLSVEESDSGKVLVMRGITGPGGFMVTSPDFNSPVDGKVVVTVTYSTESKSPGGAIRFRQTKPVEKTWAAFELPPTNGEWKTITKEIDLRNAGSGLFELATSGVGPDTALRFKAFDVTVTP